MPSEPNHTFVAPAFDQREFAHFMLKEIHEQPMVVQRCLAAYLTPDWQATSVSPFHLGILPCTYDNLAQIHIVACGTSWHAALIAQHWLEQIAGVPTRVRSASEFAAAPFPMTANTLTIAVTQSGETADTLDAIAVDQQRRAGQNPAFRVQMLGITNQPHSKLAAVVDNLIPILAGPEVGVAATKTFVGQLMAFAFLALDLACYRRAIAVDRLAQLVGVLQSLPDVLDAVLTRASAIVELAHLFATADDCILLGRGISRPIALEGALKFKETTYIHAEGYAGGEFMHGPIALLDAQIPIVVTAADDNQFQPMMAQAQKAKLYGAPIVAITTGRSAPDDAVTHALTLPSIEPLFSPFLTVVPLQLLAYHVAVQRGLNVDRPRNITKTLSQ